MAGPPTDEADGRPARRHGVAGETLTPRPMAVDSPVAPPLDMATPLRDMGLVARVRKTQAVGRVLPLVGPHVVAHRSPTARDNGTVATFLTARNAFYVSRPATTLFPVKTAGQPAHVHNTIPIPLASS